MSEPRKNHLNIDGAQVKEDDHAVASYKPILESDTVQKTEYIEAEGEYIMQLDQEDTDDLWDTASTKLLLNLYIDNLQKFKNPKIRKKNIWIEISNAVGKGPDSCDKKFRNLKLTYVRLLKKKSLDPTAILKWPYFEIFEEIYKTNGEYQPDIQQKIQDSTTESVAKALLSINKPSIDNGECSNGQSEEVKKKQNRKRFNEFRKVTMEMRDKQRTVEEKLDKLINIVEESNSIQKERNRLFEQFLQKLNQSSQ